MRIKCNILIRERYGKVQVLMPFGHIYEIVLCGA